MNLIGNGRELTSSQMKVYLTSVFRVITLTTDWTSDPTTSPQELATITTDQCFSDWLPGGNHARATINHQQFMDWTCGKPHTVNVLTLPKTQLPPPLLPFPRRSNRTRKTPDRLLYQV